MIAEIVLKKVWHCEACGKAGDVEHGCRASLYELLGALIDSHKAESPDCEFDPSCVRFVDG